MDTLSLLLSRFAVSAGVFYTGRICGVHSFDADQIRGHLHLIERGPVELTDHEGNCVHIAEPTLLFLPRPEQGRRATEPLAEGPASNGRCIQRHYARRTNGDGRLTRHPPSLSYDVVRVPWVDLLISHPQLLDCLWHMRDQDPDSPELRQRLTRHAASVRVLAGTCRTLIARSSS